MTRRTQFNGSAAGRRRVRRADLQSEESSSSEVMHRPTLSLSVSRRSSVERAVNPIDLSELFAYQEQIQKHADRIEKQNHKVWYSKPGERGVTCTGRQKVRGRSIPLV